MHDPDDDDPLAFWKGLYIAFLISGIFYTSLALLWNCYALWSARGG